MSNLLMPHIPSAEHQNIIDKSRKLKYSSTGVLNPNRMEYLEKLNTENSSTTNSLTEDGSKHE